MEILGSMLTGAANGNDSFRMDNFRRDMQAAAVMFDIQMPVNVGAGGTPVTADLVALLKYYLAQFSMAYGPGQNYKAFEGISGDELRTIARFMSMKEVANSFVGAVQTTGQKTFGAQLIYWFSPVYHAGRPRYPGADVCRTIRLDVSEGNAFPAGSLTFTRGAGNCVINVIPLYRKGAGSLLHLPNYRRINQSRLDAETPEGLVLGIWDDNAPFATTAITKYLLRVGDDEVVTNCPPLYVNDEYSALIDAGGSNMTDSETLVFFQDPFGDIERYPHGKGYLKLLSQDVATLKLRALFYPEFTESHSEEWAVAIARARGESVLITTPQATAPDAHPGVYSVGPHEVVPASSDRFQTLSGIIGTVDGNVHLSIPQHVTAAVHAAVAGAHPASAAAVRSRAVHAVARSIPGAKDSRGANRGGPRGMQGIHGHFSALGHVSPTAK